MSDFVLDDVLIRLWNGLPGPKEPGLTEHEFAGLEAQYNLEFPPDLRRLLSIHLPVGLSFPNWRAGTRQHRIYDGTVVTWSMDQVLESPSIGMLFDVEHNNFWLPRLGLRPDNLVEAKAIVQAEYARAPRLIPVFGGRYIPDRPCEPGNPVLSVSQSDIILYGATLAEYLAIEFFNAPRHLDMYERARSIEFWSDLL